MTCVNSIVIFMTAFNFKKYLMNRGYSCEELDNSITLLQKKKGENFNAVCIFEDKGLFNASSGSLNKLLFIQKELPINKHQAKKIEKSL